MRKPLGKIKNYSLAKRVRRKLAIRKKIVGTAKRPRVCMNKTNKHLVVQVVDDSCHKVLFSVQTYGKKGIAGARANQEGAKKVGEQLAKKLKESKIEQIVFDRNGHQYASVTSTLANSVRENGINF